MTSVLKKLQKATFTFLLHYCKHNWMAPIKELIALVILFLHFIKIIPYDRLRTALIRLNLSDITSNLRIVAIFVTTDL